MSFCARAVGLVAAAIPIILFPCTEGRLAPSIGGFGAIAYDDFYQLECNGVMNNGTFGECESFANYYSDSAVTTIPCGVCVNFDVPNGDNTTLENGLDIQGALIFPENYRGTIITPFVFVQGHLVIDNNLEINEDNIDMLKFVMTKTTDVEFLPHTDNSDACRGYACDVGKKTFVVAGGQVRINAIDNTCPTWVNLLDTVTNASAVTVEDYPKPPDPPSSSCSLEILQEDFESGPGDFKSALGCDDEIVNQSHDDSNCFSVENRMKTWQGPFIDIKDEIKACLVPKQKYLLRAKARIMPENPATKPYTNCHSSGTDCLSLIMHTADKLTGMKWRTMTIVSGAAAVDDGVWFDFVSEFELTEDELATSKLYQMLYFGGPELGVKIQIDDVQWNLPSAEMFPDPSLAPVCDNLIVNGDAENSDFFMFPQGFITNVGGSLSIKKETIANSTNTNSYFSIVGRDATFTSITADLITGCIEENSIYTFSQKVRLHSETPTKIRMLLKTTQPNSTSIPAYMTETLGYCKDVGGEAGWVYCQRNWLFTDVHASAEKIELSFVVEVDRTSDLDFDELKVVQYAPPLDLLVVPDSVLGCWGPGAEILQTSHTLDHADENVLSIESVTDNLDGTATVKTTTKIAKPTTVKDDHEMAVEIALLDRNVKIMPVDPNDDFNPKHGANFMVINTPDVAQTITGVNFYKMGQQGNFGRYPLHLHLNGNIEGSLISKNLVRDSNQRCYVIHGTHNVTIEYNVAYNHFGHCFMLEDGIEEQNHFNYNLGAHTKETPAAGKLSIAESDEFCATFWISNPHNYFLGNVAAGSEDTGFWYEMLELVRGPSVKMDPEYGINPSSQIFGYFNENVCHSNHGEGFKLYPNGYFPDERATFQDIRSYKNKGDGVLFHNSKNLGLDGGMVSDNRMQIEVDKQSDDVSVSNIRVVGFSPLYQFEAEAGNLISHCPAHRPISGIQLHSFLRFRDSKGYTLENITFSHFNELGGCIGTTAIEMDKEIRDGHYDAYASFRNLTFPEDALMKEKFNMCWLEENEGFNHDLALNDLSGDLNPDTVNKAPGFIVSNSSIMKEFVDVCRDMEGSCAVYCEGACYQTVNFAVPVATAYDNMVMEVTNLDTGAKVEFPGYFEKIMMVKNNIEVEDTYENYVYQRRRYYSPIIPFGNYSLQFKKEGASIWPQIVEKVWESPPDCSPHVDNNETHFVIPTPSQEECSNLVRNPGGEEGTHNYWMHSGGGIKVYEGGSSGSYAISSDGRTGAWQGPGQFLDARCLKTVGGQYEVTMKFKLIGGGGTEVVCDINQKNINAHNVCPRVSFRMRRLFGDRIGNESEVNYAYPIAETTGPFRPGEWNKIFGVFTVTETMAAANSVFMFVERARGGVDIVIDDVLIQPTVQGCSSPIYNGDFESGDTRYWNQLGTSKIDLWDGGFSNSTFALYTSERSEFWASMSQDLNLDCVVLGESYAIHSMIKLIDSNDNLLDCDPVLNWGADGMDNICPTLAIRVKKGNNTNDLFVGKTHTWTSGTWNSISATLTATPIIKNADTVTLFFTRFHVNTRLIIDDITMLPITGQDPNQLINNGDAGTGDPRYFQIKDGGQIAVVEPGYDDDYALAVTGRTTDLCGIQQIIDNSLLEASVLYKISAKFMLFYGDAFFECDPTANIGNGRCPKVTLRSQNQMERPVQRTVASVQGVYNSSSWSTIEGYINFMPNEMNSDSLLFYIDNVAANVDILLDNIQMTKGNSTISIWDSMSPVTTTNSPLTTTTALPLATNTTPPLETTIDTTLGATIITTPPLETAPLETATPPLETTTDTTLGATIITTPPLETAPLETAPLETAPLETAPADLNL